LGSWIFLDEKSSLTSLPLGTSLLILL